MNVSANGVVINERLAALTKPEGDIEAMALLNRFCRVPIPFSNALPNYGYLTFSRFVRPAIQNKKCLDVLVDNYTWQAMRLGLVILTDDDEVSQLWKSFSKSKPTNSGYNPGYKGVPVKNYTGYVRTFSPRCVLFAILNTQDGGLALPFQLRQELGIPDVRRNQWQVTWEQIGLAGNMPPKLFTTQEISRQLEVSEGTIRSWKSRGKLQDGLHYLVFCGKTRWTPEGLEHMANMKKETDTEDPVQLKIVTPSDTGVVSDDLIKEIQRRIDVCETKIKHLKATRAELTKKHDQMIDFWEGEEGKLKASLKPLLGEISSCKEVSK